MISYLITGGGILAVVGFTAISYDFLQKKKSPYHTYRTAFDQYVTIFVFRMLGSYNRKKLEKDCKNLRAVQDEKLLGLLQAAKDTKYGKIHGLSKITSREDYVRFHPLTRFDHYKPFVECLLKGEDGVITKNRPIILALTSGTNGQTKMLPMIQAQRMAFLTQGVAVSLHTMYHNFPGCHNLQKILKFFYTPKMRQSEGGTPIGPNSSSPKNSTVMLSSYSTPLPGLEIVTEPEALYVHLLFGLKDPYLGILEANFASLIYSAFVELEHQWPQLVRDIETGDLNPELDISPEIRGKLQDLLKPDPARAAELKKEFGKGFSGIARRVWPHLNVVLTVDTGSFKMYGQKLKNTYLGGVPIYSPLYGATEGLLGVNLWPEKEERPYLLMPRSMFWEFIPIAQSDEDQPSTLFADQVEKGATYELVITNISGLFRYRFGDVVRVIDFHGECPVVEYLYRQGQLLNVRGEKVSEDVLQKALNSTCTEWKIPVGEYTVVESPNLHETGEEKNFPHYVIFLEPQKDATVLGSKSLMDLNLRKQSFVYDSFREKGSIDEAVVKFVAPGTFKKLKEYHLMNHNVSPNQWKTPRVLRREDAIRVLLDNLL
ncbi:uncharacterized protein [Apostichopus japonicus]|uniref:uncharacterized protein n=1 Tax=Stichopus japonicus TaxID=307972 RepID=UPI003AB3F795